MSDIYLMERAEQDIPRSLEGPLPTLAPSQPLWSLHEHAPTLPDNFDLADVKHSFSNDDSTIYFDQLRSRTEQPDYRSAINRTAVLIGESSLMAALPYIEEDTIIMLDSNVSMIGFMAKYVDALKFADDRVDWVRQMDLLPHVDMTEAAIVSMLQAKDQVSARAVDGYSHPILDDDLFMQSQAEARKKAIIPWHADVTDPVQMLRLSQALHATDAHVTLLNLTNVSGSINDQISHSAELAGILSCLPITEQAPIMTTGFVAKPKTRAMVATGPFFGLSDLAIHGGSLRYAPSRIVDRLYLKDMPQHPADALDMGFVIAALMGTIADLDSDMPADFRIDGGY